MTKTRWFCITDWNCNSREEYIDIIGTGQIRYIAYGEEVCPDTKRKHNQMFCYFHNPKNVGVRSLNKIGDMFGKKHCRVKAMYGKVQENEAYCSKENKLNKLGDEPKQGARGDFQETCNAVTAGTITVDQVTVDDPLTFHQYGRTLQRLETIALRKKFRTEMTKGLWYYGPTGTGKSHEAFRDYSPETHYIKNLEEDWWNGYVGQPIIILNEFRGQIKLHELLDLVDKWPKTVKWKNSETVPFLGTLVIITSNSHPHDIYSDTEEQMDQFDRRFEVKEMTKVWNRSDLKVIL